MFIVNVDYLGTFDNDMQQDAHEFLNHLLNTCADILIGKSMEKKTMKENHFVILAEKKEEKEKHEKQRNKSNNSVMNVNNHQSCNGDGQHHSHLINGDIGTVANALVAEETWIHELFQGTLVSTTKCLNCETVRMNSSINICFLLYLLGSLEN